MITFQLVFPIRIGHSYSHKLGEKIEFADDNIHHIFSEAKRLLKADADALEIHIESDDDILICIDRHGCITYGEAF